MAECLFCQIVGKKVPARIVFEDDLAVAFEDIRPQAPVHTLIVPRKHIVSLDEAREEDQSLLGHLLLVARKIARDRHVDRSGYRLITNHGPSAGQSVFHMHIHLLGGRPMHWPPG